MGADKYLLRAVHTLESKEGWGVRRERGQHVVFPDTGIYYKYLINTTTVVLFFLKQVTNCDSVVLDMEWKPTHESSWPVGGSLGQRQVAIRVDGCVRNAVVVVKY